MSKTTAKVTKPPVQPKPLGISPRPSAANPSRTTATKSKVTKAPAPKKSTPAPTPKPKPAPSPSPSSSSSTLSSLSPQPTQSSPAVSASKVWVVPPRPKPGRKPSADTPPNKRKAQNRAAQRAFRERRAARVNELEDKLAEMTKERDEREARLQKQLDQIMKDNDSLKKRMQYNDNYSSSQQQYGVATPVQSAPGTPTKQSNEPQVTMADLDRALEERLPIRPESNVRNESDIEDNNDKCGFCIKDSCLCESAGLKEPSQSQPKKPKVAVAVEPSQPPRRRNSQMEIDFTQAYAKSKRQQASTEKCGFCNEGTPCMCDEFQKSAARLPPLALPSPPASTASDDDDDDYVPGPKKLPAMQPDPQGAANTSLAYECTGTPGNCMQCQEDPMSTLFCTTLASRAQTYTKATGGTFIPVSAAYQTLSRHKDFNRADLGKLVGKLQTRAGQVEVSSVANVLRELDRRLFCS